MKRGGGDRGADGADGAWGAGSDDVLVGAALVRLSVCVFKKWIATSRTCCSRTMDDFMVNPCVTKLCERLIRLNMFTWLGLV